MDWHINQTHTFSQVKNGTLSTLRKTIASLFGYSALDKDATNSFIDCLYVEYFLSDNAIKSEEASSEMHAIERELLSTQNQYAYLYILNIQENKHPENQCKKLKELRKLSINLASNKY